uniref:Uncharacterized protein n=1 Tax=Ciona savignyi TaxID=51511 RepID=H2YGM9_CIOSA
MGDSSLIVSTMLSPFSIFFFFFFFFFWGVSTSMSSAVSLLSSFTRSSSTGCAFYSSFLLYSPRDSCVANSQEHISLFHAWYIRLKESFEVLMHNSLRNRVHIVQGICARFKGQK